MTERSAGPVNVSEQRLFHSVKKKEGRESEKGKPLDISSRARAIGGHVGRMLTGEDKKAETTRNALDQMFKDGIKGLNIDIENLFELRKSVEQGRADSDIRDFYYDWIDGVTLGSLFGTEMSNEILGVVQKKDAEEVENFIGIDGLKGIGQMVVDTAVVDPKLRKVLKLLQGKAGEGGQFVKDEVSSVLDRMEDWYLNDEIDEKEAEMVLAYLTVFVTEEEGSPKSSFAPGGIDNGVERYGDGVRYGAPEGMGRVRAPVSVGREEIIELRSVETDTKSLCDWMMKTMVKMSEDPLFFANWWQQSMAGQLVNMAAERLGCDFVSKEYRDLERFGYATLSVLGMQAVDWNADANADNYGQFAPPKNMAKKLHWDDEGEKYKILKQDKEVAVLMESIMKNAFSKKNGWQVVEAFSDIRDHSSQNEYLERLLEDEEILKKLEDGEGKTKGSKELIIKGRVALAMFEVDWMPEWIRWANECKRAYAEGREDEDLPWLQSFNEEDVFDRRSGVNIGKAEFDTFAYSGTMESIVEEGGEKQEFELAYNHPRVLRPWDVMAGAKGSYRHVPEIVWAMENLLGSFMARRLSDAKGRWVRASGLGTEGGPSENVLDRYLKYGKFMFKLMGGPQGTEFDNLTTYDDLLPLAANFWGPGAHGNTEFGIFLADLFALKTEAMFFPGYPSKARETLARIRGLDVISGEKEKQAALEGVLGPGGGAAHGWVAEARRLYNIDLLGVDGRGRALYPQFYDAFVRVFVDTPDLKEAYKTYRKAIRELDRKKIGSLVEAGAGVLKILGMGG